MCGDHPEHRPDPGPPPRATRRAVLGAGAALAAGAVLSRFAVSGAGADGLVPVDVAPGLAIRQRDEWGADLPPRAAILPEDSRFLLVHHSDSPTSRSDPREVIRETYAWHTSREKGWPDVCYEFFVDPTGGVWEGRAGALAGPVVADASGGSQGFAQLVCLLGTYTVNPPSAAMYGALVSLLAWLSRRDGIAVGPAASTTFTSRGSDKWKAGTVITTNTIAGHRDMTYTACPGDAMYALLPQLRVDVVARLAAWDAMTIAHPNADGLLPARRLGRVPSP